MHNLLIATSIFHEKNSCTTTKTKKIVPYFYDIQLHLRADNGYKVYHSSVFPTSVSISQSSQCSWWGVAEISCISGQPCTLHQACLYRLVRKMRNSQGGQKFVSYHNWAGLCTLWTLSFLIRRGSSGPCCFAREWQLILEPPQYNAKLFVVYDPHMAKNKLNQMVVIPSIGGFRAARLPGQATHAVEPLCRQCPDLPRFGTASDSKPLANWQLQHQISNTRQVLFWLIWGGIVAMFVCDWHIVSVTETFLI